MSALNFTPTAIRLRQAGKLTKTSYANEIAEAVNALGAPFVLGSVPPARASGFVFTGKIVDKGPNGEADLTREAYWVQMMFCRDDIGDGGLAVFIEDKTLDGTEDGDAKNSIFYVTNTLEVNEVNPATAGTHSLLVGTIVQVRGEMGISQSTNIGSADVKPSWLISVAPRTMRPVFLTHSGGVDGTISTQCTYTYTAIDADTGNPVGTGALDVTMQRPIGKTKVATQGIAHYSKFTPGFWDIFLCDEIPSQGACT